MPIQTAGTHHGQIVPHRPYYPSDVDPTTLPIIADLVGPWFPWLDTSTGTLGTLKLRNEADDDWDIYLNFDGVGSGLTTEQVQDLVAAMMAAGTNVTLTYDDVAGTLTIDATDTTLTIEQVQDTVAAMIIEGTGISKAYDDGAGELTLTATGGGGGGSNTVHTNAYSSPPGSPVNGDTWIPSDGIGIVFYRVAGAWVARHSGVPVVTPPNAASWTQVNPGAATLSDVGGALVMNVPTGGTDSLRLAMIAAPAAPYTLTILVGALHTVTAGNRFGLALRQSSDGKLITLGLRGETLGYYNEKWNSATSNNSSYGNFSPGLFSRPIFYWLRMQDNGTNRLWSISYDGQNWIQLFSNGRTDFMTADQVGWFVNNNDASIQARGYLLSWQAA